MRLAHPFCILSLDHIVFHLFSKMHVCLCVYISTSLAKKYDGFSAHYTSRAWNLI